VRLAKIQTYLGVLNGSVHLKGVSGSVSPLISLVEDGLPYIARHSRRHYISLVIQYNRLQPHHMVPCNYHGDKCFTEALSASVSSAFVRHSPGACLRENREQVGGDSTVSKVHLASGWI
jgi:hypothetical protein